jgi:hypothetical protein
MEEYYLNLLVLQRQPMPRPRYLLLRFFSYYPPLLLTKYSKDHFIINSKLVYNILFVLQASRDTHPPLPVQEYHLLKPYLFVLQSLNTRNIHSKRTTIPEAGM